MEITEDKKPEENHTEVSNESHKKTSQDEPKPHKGNWQRFKDKLKQIYLYAVVPLLVLLLIFMFMAQRIVIIIPSGHAGVFWSMFFGGTDLNSVYGEGIHFILPFDRIIDYEVRIQEISPQLEVLSKSGLDVQLYLSIRYAPDYQLIPVLHQKVGPDYPEKVIVPQIESVLREVIGKMETEEIYTTGREVITKAIDEAVERLAQRYINVDDVIIKRIQLPPIVAETIQNKIKEKELNETHNYLVEKEKKEADRKRIEGEGLRDSYKIVSESLVDDRILKWQAIQALHAFAKSNNAKILVVGLGKDGVPIILNPDNAIPSVSNTINAIPSVSNTMDTNKKNEKDTE